MTGETVLRQSHGAETRHPLAVRTRWKRAALGQRSSAGLDELGASACDGRRARRDEPTPGIVGRGRAYVAAIGGATLVVEEPGPAAALADSLAGGQLFRE